MGFARRAGLIGALAALGLLTACSASVDPAAGPSSDPFSTPVLPGSATAGTTAASGASEPHSPLPQPRRGHGTVTALVPRGAPLPQDMVESFHLDTGFTLSQVEVPAEDLAAGAPQDTAVDVLVGLDAADAAAAASAGLLARAVPEDAVAPEGTALESVPAAAAYARDDVCVLADVQWYSANRQDLPDGLAALATGQWAQQLLVPDPGSSVEGRAFTRAAQADLGKGADAWWATLVSGGVVTGSTDQVAERWTASSAQVEDARPLLVATQSLAAATLNDTGTESAARAVPGTCLERLLYSAVAADAPDADGAQSLVAWLQGGVAQKGLASAGVAAPLSAADAEGTPIGWFSLPFDGALSLPEAELSAARDRAGSWASGSGQAQ
ncbi:MAG: hypothetical protein L0L69_07955 [Propionibacterium sp.]|nr:hypothetical protein [Propionibacterium sp.]